MPPEAQASVIEPADCRPAVRRMYLGFSSADSDKNQITDYLTRVVQPIAERHQWRQRADISRQAYLCHARWLSQTRWLRLASLHPRFATLLSKNNYLSALGNTKVQWSP